MEQHKNTLVEHIYNKSETGTEHWIKLCLDKLCNMSVDVKLVVNKTTIIIHIFLDKVHRNFNPVSLREYIYYCMDRPEEIRKSHNFYPLSKDEVLVAVNKIEDYFKNVRFDRFSNRFEYKSTATYEFQKSFLSMIENLNNNNIEPTHIECCICKELTCGKTPCKHPLCYYCWDKIERQTACECCLEGDDDECSNENKNCGLKLCPICRQDIEVVSKEYEDDY
jgi:hypothetical protein